MISPSIKLKQHIDDFFPPLYNFHDFFSLKCCLFFFLTLAFNGVIASELDYQIIVWTFVLQNEAYQEYNAFVKSSLVWFALYVNLFI